MTTPQMVVQRARNSVGHSSIYKLGAGGFNPAAPHPWNALGECDCSGFVAWCLGISRHTDHPAYVKWFGEWIETSAIVRDAQSTNGFFDEVEWKDGRPSDLLVYGDKDGHQGHVGVVVAADEDGALAVAHCSSGNWRVQHDAISIGEPALWKMHGGIVARCSLLVLA